MVTALINDVELFYEQTGEGTPLVFLHEFAGDYRSWEPQVRYLARRYQVITYNARGYPPSDVPEDEAEASSTTSRPRYRRCPSNGPTTPRRSNASSSILAEWKWPMRSAS